MSVYNDHTMTDARVASSGPPWVRGSQPAAVQRLERLAGLMDDRFRIPFTGQRFGLDSVIGLLPGIGDAVTAGISAYIVHQAWAAGAPQGLLARMAWNLALDTVLGAIPIAGDVFDLAFKSNRKNVRLLKQHFARTSAPRARGLFPSNGGQASRSQPREQVSA